MKRFNVIIVTTLTLAGWIGFSAAGELYSKNNHQVFLNNNRSILCSQIPDTLSATGYLCQLDSVLPMEADIADDILPGGRGWQIDSVIAWFDNWSYFHTWDLVPNIHFIIYRDSVGQPADSPSTEIIIDQPDYVAYMISYPGRWRVEFGLTPPVFLDTFRYWIEIQPSNSNTDNGSTGNMAQGGIGNGQDFFFRCPWGYVPTWQSSYQFFQEHLETGFMLVGTEVGITEKTKIVPVPEILAVSPTIGRDAYAVSLMLSSPRHVRIRLFNEAGQHISSVVDQGMTNGIHNIGFSLRNFSAGVYFVLVELDDNFLVQKITKMR
jgi:hypothetical protein